MKIIKTVGVVGAGTMGAALSQKFAQENFTVILADRDMQSAGKGMDSIRHMFTEAINKKVFTEDKVKNYLSNITATANLNDLKACDLVIEAIFEDFNAKTDLFKTLNGIVHNDTILATNTSSFSVDELAQFVSFPERFIGLHYFYHAAKNRLVEIIPGTFTAPEIVETVHLFSVQSGKDAISCKDAHGFVVNRFFVPWLNEAVRLLAENKTNIATIDDVCRNTFGIGMGPFALMNATGVAVACHAQKTLEVFGEFYTVSEKLKLQADARQNWNLEGTVSSDEKIRKEISDRMCGVVFYVCAQLLDEKVCVAADINRGARIGLQWRKGPVEMMHQLGEQEVKQLIQKVIQRYQIEMPRSIGAEYWKMNFVDLQKKADVAVITIHRPEDLNALNEDVVKQLDEKFSAAEQDSKIKTIFITGSGKSFVAGADIKFFVRNIKANKIADIESFTCYAQQVFKKIDESPKKVVVILNGLTLGGGLELALCADTILALPKAQLAFPETGIGIYPGLGGTQRSAKKIGKGLSKYLILTGAMLNAGAAWDIGLVDHVIDIKEMFGLFEGCEIPFREKVVLNQEWKNIEHFFEKNSLAEILKKNFTVNGMKIDEAEKIASIINRKAPVALRIADQLIEEAAGCDAELRHLTEIFSTADALTGLSAVGKPVQFSGK